MHKQISGGGLEFLHVIVTRSIGTSVFVPEHTRRRMPSYCNKSKQNRTLKEIDHSLFCYVVIFFRTRANY